MPVKYTRLSKDDAAVLLVDHQSGLIAPNCRNLITSCLARK